MESARTEVSVVVPIQPLHHLSSDRQLGGFLTSRVRLFTYRRACGTSEP
jgi:hypothetical protein